MNRRSFFYSLAAGVAVLLVIGISGYFWIISHPLTLLQGNNQVNPQSALFVPKQAPVMVSMLVNPDKLESLQQLITRPGERRRSRQELNQLKTSLLSNTGLNYERDIQPWLGEEITLAVTSQDIDRDENNGRLPGYLMVLTTKDAAKSREFLQLVFSQRAIAGKKLASEQYQGVNLIYDNESVETGLPELPEKLLSGAVVGDRFVLFANHPKVLRGAINNVQAPSLSLNSSSKYQQALTLLPTQQIGVAFLNLKSVAAWLGKQLEPQVYTKAIVALKLNRQGLLAETKLIAAPDREIASPTSTLSQPVKALKYIPKATGLAISGTDLRNLKNSDLNSVWRQSTAVLSGSSNDAISRLITQPFSQLQARWGIDFLQDIFSWVEGEYALGMLPYADSSVPDWIFVAEKSDTQSQGIAHLDAIARAKGLSITPLSLGEQNIYAWTQLTTTPTNNTDVDRSLLTLKAKVQGVHATVGDYEIFTTSVEAMDAALKAPQTGALVDTSQFKTGVTVIPQPNQGYVYLDWQASQETIAQQLPILKLIEIAGQPFFNNLRSLTLSSYGSDTEVLQSSIFFQLTP